MQGTGYVECRFRRFFYNIEEYPQCLQKLKEAGKVVNYDKVSTEKLRELMVEFQERSHVSPSFSAYYQAIVAPNFCEEVAAASTRRLAKAFEETLTSLE